MINRVLLHGRLATDVSLKVAPQTQKAVARFTVAIDRGKDRNGNDKGTDFPTIVCFGTTAENCERYLAKGRQVIVEGRIQTDSYEKDGRKVYTTDVIGERVVFVDKGEKKQETPKGFEITDDDIPF